MAGKILSGARVKMYVDNILVGIFENVSYGVNLGLEPVHTLGRYSPNEIVINSVEAITVNCGAFRVVGNGPHTLPKFPKVQDLLNYESITLALIDRQSGKTIMSVIGCVPASYNETHNARTTGRFSLVFTGIRASDEEGDQSESAGAVELP